VIKKMAQILMKKPAHNLEEQEEEFIVVSPVELQIPKPEVSRPQAKSHIKAKKGLSRLFRRTCRCQALECET
jgi:hypothetical protein